MDKRATNDFAERLIRVARHARIAYSQSAIANFLGVNRQTVDVWMHGSLPRSDKLFEIADKFGVSPRWLATGAGEMIERAMASGLGAHEEDLVDRYRMADPRWQLSMRLLSYVATEEQDELAGDVNMIIARVFGKSPRAIKYISDARAAEAIGMAPHVRKRVK